MALTLAWVTSFNLTGQQALRHGLGFILIIFRFFPLLNYMQKSQEYNQLDNF